MSLLSAQCLVTGSRQVAANLLLHLSPTLKHTFSRRLPSPAYINSTRRLLSLAPGALPDYKIARKTLEMSISEGSRFPWRDEFELSKEIKLDAETVISTLGPFMTNERLERIESVCSNRCFDVLPIVQHPYDLGNLAAVCRSADALGFGAVHVIRNTTDERFKQSARTSGGAEKWLDVQLHDSTKDCLTQAKQLGYQIVATHLRADAVSPAEIDWTKPTAIVFGNELKGVTDDVLDVADACIAIPMDGFVESFNISVAAALTLWEARRVRKEQLGRHGDLTPEQIKILKAVMVLRTRGMAKQWVTHLLKKPPPEWQVHRNKGNWHGKDFEGGPEMVIPPKERRRTCYFWDGCTCWGEKLIFPEKQCRYHYAHGKGTSTINWTKLEEGCQRVGVPVPEEVLALKKGGGKINGADRDASNEDVVEDSSTEEEELRETAGAGAVV